MMGVMDFVYLNNRYYFFLIFDIYTRYVQLYLSVLTVINDAY